MGVCATFTWKDDEADTSNCAAGPLRGHPAAPLHPAWAEIHCWGRGSRSLAWDGHECVEAFDSVERIVRLRPLAIILVALCGYHRKMTIPTLVLIPFKALFHDWDTAFLWTGLFVV